MSLFSDHWYRVAGLHPRLRPHVKIDRHAYRGEVWHLLKDPLSGRQHRLNDLGWAVVARLDGRLSMQEIWDLIVAEQREHAPTQLELIALLAQLHEAELLHTEGAQDVTQLFASADRRQTRQRRQRRNPLSLRVGLFDPTRLLERLMPLARALLQPWALWAWALLCLAALAAIAPHGGELRSYSAQHLASPRMMLLLWLAYPLIKAVHELAHALAVRAWGGEVREMGITLLLLVPVPFVDASSASGFRSRRRRVAVSLMGILAETTLAALATFVWLMVADGVLRELAFATLLIGGASTLLFNGNPLLRFDAYHALCDTIESPALGTRGDAYWRTLWRRHVLGVASARGPSVAPGERGWLLGYAAASLLYRLLISVLLVAWVVDQHLVLGLVLAGCLLYSLLLHPGWRLWRYSRDDAELDRRRGRALAVHATVLLLPLLLLVALPMPDATRASGIVWVPEQSLVRPQVDGFVEHVAVREGQVVEPGTLLLQLRDPSLQTEHERLQARLAGLDVAYHAAIFDEPAKAGGIAKEIEQASAERARVQARIEALAVRSGSHGRIALLQAEDLPGRFVTRGSVLGHVIGDEAPTVRALVSQADVQRLRQAPRAIEVSLADAPAATLSAHLAGQTPAAVRELPSAALGERFGGSLLTDPADPQGLRPLETLFVVDLRLATAASGRIGTRAQVRFDHGRSPLLQQGLHRLRQLLVGRTPPLALGATTARGAGS